MLRRWLNLKIDKTCNSHVIHAYDVRLSDSHPPIHTVPFSTPSSGFYSLSKKETTAGRRICGAGWVCLYICISVFWKTQLWDSGLVPSSFLNSTILVFCGFSCYMTLRRKKGKMLARIGLILANHTQAWLKFDKF